MTSAPFRLVVLISGNGSNLQAIIDAIHSKDLPAHIVLVVSNRKAAYGLTRAHTASIPTLTFPLKPYKDAHKTREEYDTDLATKISEVQPDLIVLAGWMHILSKEFLERFPERVINLHPALPGQFDGAHAIERAMEAYRQGKIECTGVMVHKVIPEVDRGEVIVVEKVPIAQEDTLDTLEDKIHKVEHGLLIRGIKKFIQDSL